jgi:membrane protein
MREVFLTVWELFLYLSKRFLQEGFVYRASTLTLSTLLGLVPFIAVVFSLLSFFPEFQATGKGIQQLIVQSFLPEQAQVVQTYLLKFVSHTDKLPGFGFLFLLAIAILLLITIERAFNDIWQIKRGRIGVPAFIAYWSVLSLAPIFAGLGFIASSYLISLKFFSIPFNYINLHIHFIALLPFVFNVFAFTLLYIVVPNCKVKLKHGLLGALIAALLFEGAKKIFVIYLSHVPTYTLLYGAVATVPIFLIWLYLSWVIVLFGAMISHTAETKYLHHRGDSVDGFTLAFLWIILLWEAQRKGGQLSLEALCKAVPYRYKVPATHVLDQMIAAHFVAHSDEEKYLLSCEPGSLTLFDFYKALPYRLPSPKAMAFVEHDIAQDLSSTLAAADEDLKTALSTTFLDLSEGE